MSKQSSGVLQFTTFNKKIVLEPELEQMFQLYQQNHNLTLSVLGDELYDRQVRMPKHNGPVSMLDEPRVALRHVFDWGIPTSKSAHAQRADFFRDLARKIDDEWQATVSLAVEAYGKEGSLISGVYRDHFPEDVKDRLRFLSHGKSLATDAARLHEYLSKTRSPRFQ
jgi:hypothetical protein